MRVMVSGGSGFLGSHLCEELLRRGDSVYCLDNFSSGRKADIARLLRRPGFHCVPCDITERFRFPEAVDAVAHLASPASPSDYNRHPLESLAVGSRGTENMLRLAESRGARFVLASSSEVYGDPAVRPQGEDHWGHVNPTGPRGFHYEAKRFAEALSMTYRHSHGVDTGIVRIFNTYGPRMRPHGGRVVSSLIRQALQEEPLTIFGDGTQTRSFCYVDDLVRGLIAMLDSAEPGPIDLGDPEEHTVREVAELVAGITGSSGELRFLPLPTGDPGRRRPVITRAREGLGWQPRVPLEEGLRHTVDWFAAEARARMRTSEWAVMT
ncbi:NAD-dependent epimerase/dehydratase family protein [Streptomyces triticiradicis]|uniref:NAD-dependent epimerase/dehydratase family protein n=1 Tax=Streptomyces triticiradicis TaxID=2651189 RepID=A0A7J5D8S5_9ACTN|nr:NAD-dependent epimerase/dehydratase family protein [Streptomyces triticiradicis]KAB1980774.1 NAD-dependent epimerase/dehydratase family protein [Streptomyces triticiradicis]